MQSNPLTCWPFTSSQVNDLLVSTVWLHHMKQQGVYDFWGLIDFYERSKPNQESNVPNWYLWSFPTTGMQQNDPNKWLVTDAYRDALHRVYQAWLGSTQFFPSTTSEPRKTLQHVAMNRTTLPYVPSIQHLLTSWVFGGERVYKPFTEHYHLTLCKQRSVEHGHPTIINGTPRIIWIYLMVIWHNHGK